MRLAAMAMWFLSAGPYYVSIDSAQIKAHYRTGRRGMHELVERIKDPELCYIFAKNATRRGHPELALQAYRRAVDLRAEDYPTENEAEFAAARAIFAYEEAMSYRKGKRTRATGTWQLVSRHGLLSAVHKRIQTGSGDEVSPILEALGMAEYSFEAVGMAYPEDIQQAAA
jgi:hypothetical protein